MSFYQSIKPVIGDFLQLSRDAIHIHIGFACLILTLLLTKKKLSSLTVLLAGFILSLLMEVMDLWDDYHLRGITNWGASLHDIVNTNLIPFVLVILAKFKKKLT